MLNKILKFTCLVVFVLLNLNFLSCKKNNSKESTSNQSSSEYNDENSQIENSTDVTESEYAGESPKKTFVISSTDNSDENYISFNDDDYSTFSTFVPIGCKVKIPESTIVYKAPALNGVFYQEEAGEIEANSLVYLLMISNGCCKICDENGNCGWIKQEEIAYIPQDTILEYVAEKKGYPVAKISPDNRYISFRTYDDDDIKVCDGNTLKELFSINCDSQNPPYLAYSPDCKYLYFASDKYLSRCNLETKETEKLGSPTPNEIYNDGRWEHIKEIFPSPDGKNVICSVYYESFAIYDLEQKRWNYKTGGEFMWAQSFAYSPDGKYIAGAATNPADICVWDKKTRDIIWQQCDDFSGEVYFSDDSKYLYVVNSSKVCKKEALSGKTIETYPIYLPSDLVRRNWVINEKKDAIVIVGSVTKDDDYDHYEPMIYVFQLSTGKLIHVERFNTAKRDISRIDLNNDGTKIIFEFRNSAYADDSTQVLCNIDLDKKPLEYVEPELSEEEKRNLDFVLNNEFQPGYRNLGFNEDGTFAFYSRHDGQTKGTYYIEDGYVHMSRRDDFPNSAYSTVQPIEPDYVDFDYQGRLGDYICCTPSPAGIVYEYDGISVIKYPGWGSSDAKYVYIKENLKMRDYPSTNANVKNLGYCYYSSNYDSFYIQERNIVFAGDYFRIIGKTEWEDDIDGINAPWYLIYVDDNNGGEYTEGFLTWVFGGYCTEFPAAEREYYRDKGEYLLYQSARDYYYAHPNQENNYYGEY